MQLLKEEGEENMKSQNNTKVNGIHRAHTWEIGLYALNNTSTNLYAMLMGYVSYYVSGLMGVAAVLVGTLLTVMRVWDGVTDPVIGFVVDKTNGRFGKNCPFIVIGNVIMIITTYILYHFGHKLPDNYGLRLGFFVLIYAVYIIGYTCQCVVTKSAQSCMTNDPEQRPTFAVFDAAYGGLMFAGTGMLVSKYLVPKYTVDGISGFRNPAMFHEFWLIFAGLSLLLAALSIVGLWRKDRPQYYGLGVPQQILIRDYWEILKHNRAIQMLVVAASTDKLFQNIMTNSIILVIVFGIICGDYGSYGTMSMLIIVPQILLCGFGIRKIAAKMGQRKALWTGSIGAIICASCMALLFIFGNPKDFGFSRITFFTVALCTLWILEKACSGMAGTLVIPMTADCADYETYRSGKYVPGLMGTLFSFVDKLISSLGTTIVALELAAVGFAKVQPDQTTPLTPGLFWVGIISFCLVPIIGWLCNLVAMKFYPLTKEKMAEIQDRIAEIKAASFDN